MTAACPTQTPEDLKAAERRLLARLDAESGSADLWRELVILEQRLGHRPREALALTHLCTLDPDDALAWSRLGDVSLSLGRFDDALNAYRQATTLDGTRAADWQGLALASLSVQDLRSAAEARDALLARFSDRAFTHVVDGHLHKAHGRKREAIEAYRKAIEIEPASCPALYNLTSLQTPGPQDALSGHIEALAARADLDPADRANLEFSLALIDEESGSYAAAYEHYCKANAAAATAMRNRGIEYSPAEFEMEVDALIARYPAGSTAGGGLEPLAIQLRPVFILGLPRSGTSLVEQILASHPQVAAGGELTLGPACEAALVARRKEAGRTAAVDPAHPRDRDLLLEMRERYVDGLFERDLCSRVVTDKLPGNFLILGFLRLLFPNAIFVHVKRNPVAVCWSLFTSNFGIHDPYYNSLEHLAHYHGQYERLMAHWRGVAPEAIVEVCYEDLVASPEEGIRRLVAAVGLEWDARCLQFHEHERVVLTASHSQVRRPIYTSSVDRWKHYAPYLSPRYRACLAKDRAEEARG